MKRRTAILLLCLVPLAGCRSTNVRIFGLQTGGTASTKVESGSSLSTEEKLGVLLIVGLVVAAVIAGASR